MNETQREWNRETRRAPLESIRKDTTDPTLSVGDTVFCGGVYATVTEIKNYAPGEHDHSPIKNEMNAVEVATDNGSRWHGRESRYVQERLARSGYTPCACRDCMDVTVSSDTNKPKLCSECQEAGCTAIAPYNERVQFCTTYECQRDDAYGEA